MLDDFIFDPAGERQNLARPALAIELAGRLRQMIVAGELRPGEKIPERALTERFGVSRTPVREAIKVLAAEGYAKLVPNRGSIVAELTIGDLEEAFPIIAALEGAAGELASRHASNKQIAAIRKANDSMHAAYRAGNRGRYVRLNQEIHAAILAAAGNPMLLRHHRKVAQTVERARYQANRLPGRWREALGEHDAIVEALEARDGERLGRLMKSHLEHKLEALRKAAAD